MKNINFIKGISIISKYLPDEELNKSGVYADHEKIYFGRFDMVPEGEDKEMLMELGWFESRYSWCCFT